MVSGGENSVSKREFSFGRGFECGLKFAGVQCNCRHTHGRAVSKLLLARALQPCLSNGRRWRVTNFSFEIIMAIGESRMDLLESDCDAASKLQAHAAQFTRLAFDRAIASLAARSKRIEGPL